MTDPTPGPPGASAAGERVEVVDENGTVVDVVSRADLRARRLRHRTVFIAVVSTDGERLLVHRRADWKDIWPSRWDVAFGGVVGVGEDWDVAARRELAEEAGLTAPPARLSGDEAVSYEDDEVLELAHVYLARSDGPPTCPDGEVAETAWVALDGVAAWMAGRALCPDSVALVVPHVARALPGSDGEVGAAT